MKRARDAAVQAWWTALFAASAVIAITYLATLTALEARRERKARR